METLFNLPLWNNLYNWVFFSFFLLCIFFLSKDYLSLLYTFQGAAFVFLVDFKEVFVYYKILHFILVNISQSSFDFVLSGF